MSGEHLFVLIDDDALEGERESTRGTFDVFVSRDKDFIIALGRIFSVKLNKSDFDELREF